MLSFEPPRPPPRTELSGEDSSRAEGGVVVCPEPRRFRAPAACPGRGLVAEAPTGMEGGFAAPRSLSPGSGGDDCDPQQHPSLLHRFVSVSGGSEGEAGAR